MIPYGMGAGLSDQDIAMLQRMIPQQQSFMSSAPQGMPSAPRQPGMMQQGKNGAAQGASMGLGAASKGIGSAASSGASAGAGASVGMGLSPYSMGAQFLASSGLLGKPASSALSRAATGAQLGSLGGPIGTGIGAGVGGLMGLMEGKSGQRGPANVPIQQIPMGGY